MSENPRMTFPAQPQWTHSAPITWNPSGGRTDRIDDPRLTIKAPDQLLGALGGTWSSLVQVVGALENLIGRMRGTGESRTKRIMANGVIAVARQNNELAGEALAAVQMLEEMIGELPVEEGATGEIGVSVDVSDLVEDFMGNADGPLPPEVNASLITSAINIRPGWSVEEAPGRGWSLVDSVEQRLDGGVILFDSLGQQIWAGAGTSVLQALDAGHAPESMWGDLLSDDEG